MYSKQFRDMPVGSLFRLNGNDYRKQSTRTARNLNFDRVFYIGQREVVHPVAW